MGGIQGASEHRLMTAGEVAVHLLEHCKSLEQFDAYMFGSTLRGVGGDIDILIVGPDGDMLSRLKRKLEVAGEYLPLHILYMLPSEANRTEFMTKEQCVPLTLLAQPRPQ